MRVLQVVTDDDRRGGQVFASELGGRLSEMGWDVRDVALAPGRVGGLGTSTLGPSRRHPSTLRRLRTEMLDADVVVAHGSTTLPACALAGIRVRRPLVYRQISDPLFWAPTRLRRLRTIAAYRATTAVVALSPITATILGEHFRVAPSRISVIPNAVDERRFRRATDNDRAEARQRFGLPASPVAVVAAVGALVEEKGIDDLIAVARPGETILVAGDGPHRATLEQAAADRGVDARFTGALSDPWAAYAAADIVVLPSRGGDSQPAVLIEAALVGTVCVATDVGAVRDIVGDRATGRLVPAGDQQALRRALDDLQADPPRRAALEEQAAGHAIANFSMSVVAQQWAELLTAVVHRPRGRP